MAKETPRRVDNYCSALIWCSTHHVSKPRKKSKAAVDETLINDIVTFMPDPTETDNYGLHVMP